MVTIHNHDRKQTQGVGAVDDVIAQLTQREVQLNQHLEFSSGKETESVFTVRGAWTSHRILLWRLDLPLFSPTDLCTISHRSAPVQPHRSMHHCTSICPCSATQIFAPKRIDLPLLSPTDLCTIAHRSAPIQSHRSQHHRASICPCTVPQIYAPLRIDLPLLRPTHLLILYYTLAHKYAPAQTYRSIYSYIPIRRIDLPWSQSYCTVVHNRSARVHFAFLVLILINIWLPIIIYLPVAVDIPSFSSPRTLDRRIFYLSLFM